MEGVREGSLLIAMEDEHFEEYDSDEYELVAGKNGRVKRKSTGGGRGEGRWIQRSLMGGRRGRVGRHWQC